MNASARRVAVVASFALASLGCCALVGVRIIHTHVPNFTYLIWNLFLAWIPFVLAILLYDGQRRGARKPALVVLGALWLAFFPNAPYIVTDFVHLDRDPLSPYWFDGLIITSFAVTGMLLGLGSLYLVQSVVRREAGTVAGWVAAATALVLGSIGIYVGRFVRLNSWDLWTSPRAFLHLAGERLADPLGNPRLLAITVASTLLMGAAYLILYTFATAGLRLDLERG
ncbi:MAG: DUF1361 domain-containing protein [Gaiellaceae bacterium]|jgi:uncharacterized membrane protein